MAHETYWNGKNDGDKVLMIDTPGVGDCEGRDAQYIADIIDNLKEQGYMNGLLIVFNGQNPRFDEHL